MKTVSVTSAKAQLGKLCDQSLAGSPVAIVRRNRLFVLAPIEVGEVLPKIPPGHVAHIYTPENLAAVGSHEERLRRLELATRSRPKTRRN